MPQAEWLNSRPVSTVTFEKQSNIYTTWTHLVWKRNQSSPTSWWPVNLTEINSSTRGGADSIPYPYMGDSNIDIIYSPDIGQTSADPYSSYRVTRLPEVPANWQPQRHEAAVTQWSSHSRHRVWVGHIPLTSCICALLFSALFTAVRLTFNML